MPDHFPVVKNYAYCLLHCPYLEKGRANRIVPTIAIPHPFGDPELGKQEEKQQRRKLVEKVIRSLMSPIEE